MRAAAPGQLSTTDLRALRWLAVSAADKLALLPAWNLRRHATAWSRCSLWLRGLSAPRGALCLWVWVEALVETADGSGHWLLSRVVDGR
jgi:hypothetical protein